jgi:hypothetical protein
MHADIWNDLSAIVFQPAFCVAGEYKSLQLVTYSIAFPADKKLSVSMKEYRNNSDIFLVENWLSARGISYSMKFITTAD